MLELVAQRPQPRRARARFADTGPGIADIAARADRRLHDRQRARARAVRGPPARRRVRRSTARRATAPAVTDHQVGPLTWRRVRSGHRVVRGRRRQRGRRGAPRRGAAGRAARLQREPRRPRSASSPARSPPTSGGTPPTASIGVQIALRDDAAGRARSSRSTRGPGMGDARAVVALDGHSTTRHARRRPRRDRAAVVHASTSARSPGAAPCSSPTSGRGAASRPIDAIDVGGRDPADRRRGRCAATRSAARDGRRQPPADAQPTGSGTARWPPTRRSRRWPRSTRPRPTDPASLLSAIHARLIGTRGAAVAVAVDRPVVPSDALRRRRQRQRVRRTTASAAARPCRSPASSVTTVAASARSTLELATRRVVVMHSDGVRESWDLRDTPGPGATVGHGHRGDACCAMPATARTTRRCWSRAGDADDRASPMGSLAHRARPTCSRRRAVARDVAASLGFDAADQVRIATAISELGRR